MYNQQRGRLSDVDNSGRGGSGSSTSGYHDEYRSTNPRRSSGNSSESVVHYDRKLMMRLIASRMEQIGLRMNQDVKQYKDIPCTDLMPYRMRRVVSPFEFYLELGVWSGDLSYSTWFPQMQKFYDDPQNQDDYSVAHGIPLVGRCYVCRDYEDNKWHRVRVHHIKKDHPISTLVVFYLDLCKLQEVTIRELLELDPQFAQYPANVFRCYLQDILPANGNRLEFTPNATMYLKEYMKNKVFTGLVLNRSNSVIVEGLPDFITDLGIVLVENIPGTRTPQPDACTLNAMMVDLGFAVATGVSASCRHIGDIEVYTPSFDQNEYERLFPGAMEKRLTRSQQKMQDLSLDERPPESIPLAVETGEPKPSTSTHERGTPASSKIPEESTTTEEAMPKKKEKQTLPEVIVQRLGHVRISFVLNPSCMVIHLKCRESELEAMQEAIKDQVEDREWLTMARPGTFVALNILDVSPSGTRPDRSIWCRGIITAVNKEGVYKVLLADYGNEAQTHSQYVRALPTYFHEMPSFAIRIHLDVEGLVPAGQSGWTLQASMDFRHYAFIWEEKGPVYCVYRPGHAKCFELEDYAQQVVYNHGDGEWIPSPQYRRQIKHGAINSLKDHPIIHSLFVSCGVELMYEIMTPGTKHWYFETISDILMHKKHGVRIGGGKEKTSVLHRDIILAAESGKVDRHPSLPIAYGSSPSGYKKSNGNQGDRDTARGPSRIMRKN